MNYIYIKDLYYGQNLMLDCKNLYSKNSIMYAKEDFSTTINNIIKTIISFFQTIWKKIKEYFNKFLSIFTGYKQITKKLERECKIIKQKLKSTNKHISEEDMENLSTLISRICHSYTKLESVNNISIDAYKELCLFLISFIKNEKDFLKITIEKNIKENKPIFLYLYENYKNDKLFPTRIFDPSTSYKYLDPNLSKNILNCNTNELYSQSKLTICQYFNCCEKENFDIKESNLSNEDDISINLDNLYKEFASRRYVTDNTKTISDLRNLNDLMDLIQLSLDKCLKYSILDIDLSKFRILQERLDNLKYNDLLSMKSDYREIDDDKFSHILSKSFDDLRFVNTLTFILLNNIESFQAIFLKFSQNLNNATTLINKIIS